MAEKAWRARISIKLHHRRVKIEIRGSDFGGKTERIYAREQDAKRWFDQLQTSPLKILRALVQGPWEKGRAKKEHAELVKKALRKLEDQVKRTK